MDTARAARDLDAETADLIEAVRVFAVRAMRATRAPGMNIAVARSGRVVWEEGFGHADATAGVAVTPDTVMRSGSMGKTYTATAAMQLVERGVIGLHDPVNAHLDFEVRNPLGERDVTVHDLLTHQLGLASNSANSRLAPPPPLREHLPRAYARGYHEFFGGTALPMWAGKVGERYTYSNLGMATLGYLVERTNPDGLSFPDYVQRHVIDPLGMRSTQYPAVHDPGHVRADVRARFSTGYAGFGAVRVPTPAIFFADYPAGNVVTTPGDHVKLLLAFMGGGSGPILGAETVRAMLTPQVDMGAPPHDLMRPTMGMTWMLRRIGERDFCFEHGGAHMFGWHSQFAAWPELDLAVAACANQWSITTSRSPAVPVCFYAARWLTDRRTADIPLPASVPETDERPDPAKTSYLIGLLIAWHVKWRLGAPEPLPEDAIQAMETRPDADDDGLWDAGWFRAGVADMLTAEPGTLEAVARFFESGRLRVPRDELEALWTALGGVGPLAMLQRAP